MATFRNQATLSYTGGTVNSNTVTGELLDILTVTKAAAPATYTADGILTYVITLRNSGSTALTALTVSDDLGAYTLNALSLVPLSYVDGSALYYTNGVPQASPAVTAGPPLVFSGLSIPAGGEGTLVYQARATSFAPLGTDGAITNTATVNGTGAAAQLSASATVSAWQTSDLSIVKSVSPLAVAESDRLTYTFLIQNYGNTAATDAESIVLTDTFSPILSDLAVTYNGTAWQEGTQYTYTATSGLFATVAGQITVPGATYTQDQTSGAITVTPGVATLTVSGTV